MSAEIFAQSLLLGFAVAAPIGPVSLLCIRRTITQGRLVGLVSGLGAALADAVVGGTAAFALSLVSDLMVEHGRVLQRLGGVALIAAGAGVARRRRATAPTRPTSGSCAAALCSSFLLTLANPATALSFALTLTALGLAREHDPGAAFLVGAGVFCGATLWWALLCSGARAACNALGTEVLAGLNRLIGAAVAAFGLAALLAA